MKKMTPQFSLVHSLLHIYAKPHIEIVHIENAGQRICLKSCVL